MSVNSRMETISELKSELDRFQSVQMHGVKIYEAKVTPDLAKLMLKLNTKNRHLNPRTLAGITHQMVSNLWAFTGEPVKFDKDWLLIDKQHTLNGIVESDKPQNTLVITGLERKVFGVLDQNLKRTLKQIGDREGVYVGEKDALFAKYVYWDINDLVSPKSMGDLGKWRYNDNLYLILNTWANDKQAKKSVDFLDNLNVPTSVHLNTFSRTSLLFAHWKLVQVNKRQADVFIKELATGIATVRDSPEDQALKVIRRMRDRSHRISHRKQIALIIQAWNIQRSNNGYKALRLPAEMPQAL